MRQHGADPRPLPCGLLLDAALLAAGCQAVFSGSKIRVIDFGGGDGFVGGAYASTLAHLLRAGKEAVIVDPLERPYGLAEVTHLRGEPPSGRYDVVILSHVLEHSHGPLELLSAAVRAARAGSVVIAEVPDERTEWIRTLLGRRPLLRRHAQQFSPSALARALHASGLRGVRAFAQPESSA